MIPSIDPERLRVWLLRMARIGATPAGGVTRPALSDADREARDLFAAWAREAGLALRVDDLGTQYARCEGTDPGLAPVLVGSHLDSVPLGGKFDGPLGVAAARIVVGLRDLALAYPDPVVATVGRLRPQPGIVNQIPGQVVMSADVRHWTPEGLAEIGRRAGEMIDRIAAEERVEAEVELLQDVPLTTFDRRLVGLLEAQARALDVPCRRLVAGAGHDAKYMSEIAPTAMLFVRTVGGKSHCETEDVHWQDVGLAGNVLLGSVLALADER